ncbi:MAG: hypothetical protein JRI25_15305, partial [Deltaproteobacteria bacterium]|nr:hypothetical protein [Deltaproteobacteria bacterium]
MADQDKGKQGRGLGIQPPPDHPPAVTSLVAAPPPPRPSEDMEPEEIESYVRASMHQDRRPGNVLAVCHPLRMYKLPRSLFAALRQAGFRVEVVQTRSDRVESVTAIRDGLLDLAREDKPLDVIAVSGDGSLDHHVLIAAFWAFYPDLVSYWEGEISVAGVTEEDLAALPEEYRRSFFAVMPDASDLDPSSETVTEIWQLRSRLETVLRKGRSVSRVVRKARREKGDLLLRVAILAALYPDKVILRPHGFDLSKLASATQERTFQGLYPYIRSIAPYPAGTAADNALFAGVPGWGFAQLAKVLAWLPSLDPIRRWWEERLTARFLAYYVQHSVVVPARFSMVAFNGDWQLISSHAAGGPGAGHFFSADLSSKTKGLLGYLARIPKVVIQEGLLGSTIVRIRSRYANGRQKSFTEGQMAEGLYTNRTFIAGVGSVPSTNPTSFAGQSSLVVVPPILYRNNTGDLQLNFRGIGAFFEAMLKGILGRLMHLVGLNVRTLAGGGKLAILWPEHQVTIKEGEEIDIEYFTKDRQPRFVPTQVSGDPFQASRMTIRVAWGPIPLLANEESLLLEATRRSLAQLRIEQSYRLRGEFIGGLYYFRHQVGATWTPEFSERTGLFQAPRYLRRSLAAAQNTLIEAWQRLGTGVFVDTSESGLQLGRRGRYAHNNDQSAHLVVIKESRNTLLVRQVRTTPSSDEIYEARTWYRGFGPSYIIHHSQTR